MAALITKENEPNGRKAKKYEDSVFANLRDNSKEFSFTIFDLAVLIFSVFSIIVDICTDIVLVVQYSNQGYKAWAIGTFVLIFIPSIVVQFFSLRWHIVDNTASVLHWVLHFCMLGLVHRYVQIIRTAFATYKSKNSSDIQKIFFEQSDLSMLHLFESFLESAPQLVLQMYVIAMLHEWRFWTGASAVASLLSLAWALAAYTKAQRQAVSNKNSATWPGLLLQAIWRTGMLTSRITTLVLGAYCFGNYIILIITIHWLSMTVWIIFQKTDFCETYWEEKIYNAVVGVIYCFCFFNLQEGQSRWRALAFYLVIVFQNLTCLTIFLMWYGERAPKLAVSGFVAIVCGTILGATSMLLYYRFFHPSGPIKFIFTPQPAEQTATSPSYSSLTLRSLKRNRCEAQKDLTLKNSAEPSSTQDLNKSSNSVVIIEETVSDDTDVEIKILQDWINDVNTQNHTEKASKNETEGDAYKRRAICSSVDLVKLIESKTESESSRVVGTDEASSEVLSAHDYENLCAVNIAREAWGLRSWRGYSDIETWLHDDSVVNDRRLDTLTSTTSSDRSANTLQKSESTRQDDYMEAIVDDLAQCESEVGSDDVLGQYSIDSFPVVYSLGTLDPIFEEIEETSTNSTEFTDLKMTNGSASTLVATIDEIRLNTPIQNRYAPADSIYDGFFPSNDFKRKHGNNWKKVTFASKLMTFPEDDSKPPSTEQTQRKTEHATIQNKKQAVEGINSSEEKVNIPTKEKSTLEKGENLKVEMSNKENIPTVASKISHWNKILNLQNEKNVMEKIKSTSPKKVNLTEKKPSLLLRVLTPPNFPTFQRKNKLYINQAKH